MRLVKVTAQPELAEKIIGTAFDAGLTEVTLRQVEKRSRDGSPPEQLQVIDIETSTPKARRFVDLLLSSDYYDPKKISLNTRQPRSLINDADDRELTRPLVEPPTDLYQELWQFSHVTFGLTGRMFLGGCLLAYGLIEGRTLLIISGLLFLPLLPLIMAMSFGVAGGRTRLALEGAGALAVSAALLFAGGALIAAISEPPLRFDEVSSPLVGVIICIGVGIAATLAAEDDTGRRELIGLAGAAQVGMLPVLAGVSCVLVAPLAGPSIPKMAGMFLLNVFSIWASAMVTQYVTGVVGSIRFLRK